MLITKEIEIDLAHRVPNHRSKCSNLHGHRYKIEVGVDDKIITEAGSSSEGMVIDFGDLKQIMMDQLDAKYDHNSIFWENDPNLPYYHQATQHQQKKMIVVPWIPTAENLAKHWFEIMEGELREVGIKINHVKVWETPTSTATYGIA